MHQIEHTFPYLVISTFFPVFIEQFFYAIPKLNDVNLAIISIIQIKSLPKGTLIVTTLNIDHVLALLKTLQNSVATRTPIYPFLGPYNLMSHFM